MRSLQKHSNMFQRLPITETYLFGPKHTLFGGEGQGGKTNWPKKIYIPHVIFKIPGPPCLPLLDCVESQYSCCYHSLHLDIGILRSVKFFIYSAFFNKLLPLVLSLGSSGSVVYNPLHQFEQFEWGNILTLVTITMSLAANALVTGLIVFKIFKVYCKVKPFYGQSFGASGGSKLRLVIFILIESWMALFYIQVALMVVSFVSMQAATNAVQPIFAVYQM